MAGAFATRDGAALWPSAATVVRQRAAAATPSPQGANANDITATYLDSLSDRIATGHDRGTGQQAAGGSQAGATSAADRRRVAAGTHACSLPRARPTELSATTAQYLAQMWLERTGLSKRRRRGPVAAVEGDCAHRARQCGGAQPCSFPLAGCERFLGAFRREASPPPKAGGTRRPAKLYDLRVKRPFNRHPGDLEWAFYPVWGLASHPHSLSSAGAVLALRAARGSIRKASARSTERSRRVRSPTCARGSLWRLLSCRLPCVSLVSTPDDGEHIPSLKAPYNTWPPARAKNADRARRPVDLKRPSPESM